MDQFDVTTGEALSGPVPGNLGNEVPPPTIGALPTNVASLMQHVRTEPIGCYRAKVETDWVWIAFLEPRLIEASHQRSSPRRMASDAIQRT